ncbi:hypothetical protein EVAR_62665_1 [Eumeta japonica]|uniref:Uncharacterized protein n=1 Tax=Eumeta variegata TaxID=151549 RepID=A0A4C1Z4D0_EUMVA|nr:hypothetical protein EVAR_62665_1 [Eumeta japonica]
MGHKPQKKFDLCGSNAVSKIIPAYGKRRYFVSRIFLIRIVKLDINHYSGARLVATLISTDKSKRKLSITSLSPGRAVGTRNWPRGPVRNSGANEDNKNYEIVLESARAAARCEGSDRPPTVVTCKLERSPARRRPLSRPAWVALALEIEIRVLSPLPTELMSITVERRRRSGNNYAERSRAVVLADAIEGKAREKLLRSADNLGGTEIDHRYGRARAPGPAPRPAILLHEEAARIHQEHFSIIVGALIRASELYSN